MKFSFAQFRWGAEFGSPLPKKNYRFEPSYLHHASMDILYERLMIILCKRLPAAVYSGKIEKNFLFLAEFIYATTMHCILSQLNLFMLIYTIIF